MKKKALLFFSSLLAAACTMAQTITFSFEAPVQNATTQTIRIVATSSAAIPVGSFSGGRLGFRFPISATGKTAATYGQNYGVTSGADANFTSVSFPASSLNGFYDATAGTTGITTFLLGDAVVGGTTDSYLYVGLSYSSPAATTAVAANTPVTIVQFDVPLSWTGADVIEFTTTANDKLGEGLSAQFDASIIHSSAGLGNLAAVGANGSFGSSTSAIQPSGAGKGAVRIVGGTLQVPGGGNPLVRVYSLAGQLVLQSSGSSVSVASLAPGAYIVEVDGVRSKVVK